MITQKTELTLDYKAILFDLDGTLLDTHDMILTSFRHACATVLLPEEAPPDDKLMDMIGIPLKTQMEIIAPEKSEALFDAYVEKNSQIQETMLGGFEGTEQVLNLLLAKGLRLGVVTSKRHGPAIHGLKQMGLDGYFEFVLGADNTKEHKPKPGPLLDGAKLMGLSPFDCAYIGDSPYDMQAAVSANMYAVGALWGMFEKQALVDTGADVIISDIRELPGLFS